MKSETLKDSGADLALVVRRHPWLTTIAAIFLVCVVVFFCFEWRAEQRWQRYAAAARARGVKLMLTDFARPEVPDEQNFAALPMFRRRWTYTNFSIEPAFAFPRLSLDGSMRPTRRSPWNGWPPFGDPFVQQHTVDWVQWQKAFQAWGFLSDPTDQTAADVLRALEHYAPEFQEWRQWRVRPQCRFPLDVEHGGWLPWPCLQTFRCAVMVFTLRMRAHLAMGDSAAAYEDFEDGLQAYRALIHQPGLNGRVTHTYALQTLINGMGGGLQSHEWSAVECRKIQATLSAIRIWDDWAFALSSERASVNTHYESWMKTPLWKRGNQLGSYWSNTNRSIISVIPRGWIRDSQRLQNQYFDELLARVDTANQTFNPDGQTPSAASNFSSPIDQYHYLFYYVTGANYETIQARFAGVAVLLDEARIACALELFRAKHQAYPEKLGELMPEFIQTLPTDIYSRAPYRYQRLGKSSYRLYSVGRNRTDEGGAMSPNQSEWNQLDAVWPYAPAPAAPTAP